MGYAGTVLEDEIRAQLMPFDGSVLEQKFRALGLDNYVIKYLDSTWAARYQSPTALKISTSPLQTWGTATYVSPLLYPLSSALYGRVGVVCPFDPADWTVFDATSQRARSLYIRWARAQPEYADLLLTVHSTIANHRIRNRFRRQFEIDCVLFRPDQEAQLHTDSRQHVWMAVSDWGPMRQRQLTTMSHRLSRAMFTVLVDEDFESGSIGLPIAVANRLIEPSTRLAGQNGRLNRGMSIAHARAQDDLAKTIAECYEACSYLHLYIAP